MSSADFEERSAGTRRRARSGRALRTTTALLVLFGLGCSTPPLREQNPIDCTDDDAYQLEPLGLATFYGFGDETPNQIFYVGNGGAGSGDIAEGNLDLYGEPPRCEDTSALHFYSARHQDWGSGFAAAIDAAARPDGSGYDGIAFWAKSNPRSDKSFSVVIDDVHTSEEGGTCLPAETAMSLAFLCGNSFEAGVVVSRFWEFYTIPFEWLLQTPRPNVVPEGIDPSAIYNFVIRPPKDTTLDLWIDQLSFYTRLP